jgi:hypothetical protein
MNITKILEIKVLVNVITSYLTCQETANISRTNKLCNIQNKNNNVTFKNKINLNNLDKILIYCPKIKILEVIINDDLFLNDSNMQLYMQPLLHLNNLKDISFNNINIYTFRKLIKASSQLNLILFFNCLLKDINDLKNIILQKYTQEELRVLGQPIIFREILAEIFITSCKYNSFDVLKHICTFKRLDNTYHILHKNMFFFRIYIMGCRRVIKNNNLNIFKFLVDFYCENNNNSKNKNLNGLFLNKIVVMTQEFKNQEMLDYIIMYIKNLKSKRDAIIVFQE